MNLKTFRKIGHSHEKETEIHWVGNPGCFPAIAGYV